MALENIQSDTPGQRQLVIVDRSGLWKGKPVKTLTEGLTKKGGRNNTGRITSVQSRRRSQAHLPHGRFQASREGVGHGRADRIRSQPDRIHCAGQVRDGDLSYILAPQRLNQATPCVRIDQGVDVKPGNCMPLSSMPVGTIIHNVEMKPGKGGQIARSAGAYAQLVGRDQGMASCV
jgi:large subunit ribosomal protein L2